MNLYAGSWTSQKRRATRQLLRFRELTSNRGIVRFIFIYANVADPSDPDYIVYYSLLLDTHDNLTVLVDQITNDTAYVPDWD